MVTPNEDNSDDQSGKTSSNEPDESLPQPAPTPVDLQRERLAVKKNRDRLQHKQQLKQLENEERRNSRLHRLALLGIFLANLILVFLLVMAFFGNERQSAIALQILNIGGRVISGAGGIFLVWFVANRLIRR
ncbi:MAG: hypothetical protein OXL37_07805 [Chloroflexota bacterium]|nr:hypothetical protein [Chloroflexota bacterium]MDE2960299.1 hypothetical protein [Chloroflexota bacterium]